MTNSVLFRAYDLFHAYDTVIAAIESLKAGRDIQVGDGLEKAAPVIIYAGRMALSDARIRALADLTVWVECDENVMVERGTDDMNQIIDFYKACEKIKEIDATKKYATVIVNNNNGNISEKIALIRKILPRNLDS